jgi:hypothetical protein
MCDACALGHCAVQHGQFHCIVLSCILRYNVPRYSAAQSHVAWTWPIDPCRSNGEPLEELTATLFGLMTRHRNNTAAAIRNPFCVGHCLMFGNCMK